MDQNGINIINIKENANNWSKLDYKYNIVL